MNVSSKKKRRAEAEEPVEVFRAHLAKRAIRFTAQRRDVLVEVLANTGHFDAEDLYGALRTAGRAVSLATVYRTLGLLRECGLIRPLPHWEDRERYETVHGREHHDHMLCVGCGRVTEFFDGDLEALQGRICSHYGFAPIDHRMGIRGLCRACRSRAGAKDG